MYTVVFYQLYSATHLFIILELKTTNWFILRLKCAVTNDENVSKICHFCNYWLKTLVKFIYRSLSNIDLLIFFQKNPLYLTRICVSCHFIIWTSTIESLWITLLFHVLALQCIVNFVSSSLLLGGAQPVIPLHLKFNHWCSWTSSLGPQVTRMAIVVVLGLFE